MSLLDKREMSLQHEIDMQDDEDSRFQSLVDQVEALIIDWKYDQIDELISGIVDDGIATCSFSFYEYLSEVVSGEASMVLGRFEVEKHARFVAELFLGCLKFK